jgi:hypothetical protein
MALKVNYIMPDSEYVEGAYLRIVKMSTANVDYEFYEKSDKPDVEEELKWVTRLENEATIYVYSDEGARANRAQVIHWFNFKFGYELDSVYNLYEQAYQQLNKYKYGNEGLDV